MTVAKKSIAASTLFFILIFTGGLWFSVSRFLPDGISRTILVIGMGFAFVAVFLWLLVIQIRGILGTPTRLWLSILMVLVNFCLLLLAFGWIYHQIGIVDTTKDDPATTHHFGSCIYFSVVTFTTLGYGDFHPTGYGRVLAALQAVTGYLILGILASTAASLLSPREPPWRGTEFREQD